MILASAVSNIDVAFIDGVHGDTVLEKTLPPERNKNLKASSVGSWRAHLNAIAEFVLLRSYSTSPSNSSTINILTDRANILSLVLA